MSGTKGYRSYRGRMPKGRIALMVILILVIVASAAVIWLQNYVVYTADGQIRLELPWQREETPPAEEETLPEEDVEGIVQEPEVLILDEPTANLDVKHQVYVTELLRALAIEEGMIVLMISHDLNIAARYAHCIILMKDGTIEKVGTPLEVITKENVRDVYEVDCDIEYKDGRPHVVLDSVLSI